MIRGHLFWISYTWQVSFPAAYFSNLLQCFKLGFSSFFFLLSFCFYKSCLIFSTFFRIFFFTRAFIRNLRAIYLFCIFIVLSSLNFFCLSIFQIYFLLNYYMLHCKIRVDFLNISSVRVLLAKLLWRLDLLSKLTNQKLLNLLWRIEKYTYFLICFQ